MSGYVWIASDTSGSMIAFDTEDAVIDWYQQSDYRLTFVQRFKVNDLNSHPVDVTSVVWSKWERRYPQ